MDNDYYSIDAILAENQKVQCTFKVDVPDLGYLDGGSDRDIKALSKLQLPFWLTPMLLYSDFADCTVPHAFNQRVRNALNADATSVKLSGLVGSGGLWYAFGRMIAGLVDDEQAQDISEMLSTTFKQRLVNIMDQAHHFGALGAANSGGAGQGQAGEDFREGLDGTERELFALAQESAKLTKQWFESSDKAKR
ncbi:GINS complex, Psf3 component [Fomitiporia mediterranea MF3/22]|uniref:GINS complex, Psf3 component n=1 Tax=Fomitiporia mediterranea (strain MF3/22) TaxID=694068 RepID=UPI0004407F87|nr:GINS complex, Psf3 component [Fomitiporia mediterranea MF3/22]EJD01215.1 GINS complex, Psf3 component [Fomitiporia mediterranea MF3/22]